MANMYLELIFIACSTSSESQFSFQSYKFCSDLRWACDNDALLCLSLSYSGCSRTCSLHSLFPMSAKPTSENISQLNINGLKNVSRSTYKQESRVTPEIWGNEVLLRRMLLSQNEALHKQTSFSYLTCLKCEMSFRILHLPHYNHSTLTIINTQFILKI